MTDQSRPGTQSGARSFPACGGESQTLTQREAEAQTSHMATTPQHKACVPASGTFTPRTKPRVIDLVLRALCELSRQGQSPSPRHPHPVTWASMLAPFSHHCQCPGLLLVYLTSVKPVHLSEPCWLLSSHGVLWAAARCPGAPHPAASQAT